MTGVAGAAVPGVTPLWTHDPVTAGPYQLVGRLGSGGQGVVYLGEDTDGHRVAVKVINIDLKLNPKAKSQFMKEIAAARRVAPFCTAQLFFAEVDGDLPYVVSEFIEGPTLQRHVREHGPVTGNALHRLAVGTATAVAAIHRADVVHCDLKPDNVILGQDGPRVIDFGISRALDITETVTNRVMGTTAYMAPERFRNDQVGAPCDVFAWAATIAYAASGRPPFGNDSLASVMHRILNEEPDLPDLPGSLDELVRHCLDKDQWARPDAEQVLLRLLGQDAKPAARLRPETVLLTGNQVAAAASTDPGTTGDTSTPPGPAGFQATPPGSTRAQTAPPGSPRPQAGQGGPASHPAPQPGPPATL